jgi:hypothetical protein
MDLLLLAVMTAFFGVAVLFVRACGLIVGPDVETTRVDAEAATTKTEVAA